MKWSIPERIVAKGREYAAEGRVVSIEADVAQEKWYAEVLGSEVYQVELDGTAKENDICECSYWQEKGYCKHTVAVELALRGKGYSRVIKMNDSLPVAKKSSQISKAFTKRFAGLQEKEFKQDAIETKPLKAEFLLESIETIPFHPEKSLLTLQLKIGYQGKGYRSYLVKNIGEFLIAYEKQGIYELKKEMRLLLKKNSFRSEDRQLLDMAVTFYQSMQMGMSSATSLPNKLEAKRLILPKTGAEDFVKWLVDAGQFQMKIADKNYTHIAFLEEGEMPMHFILRPFQEGYLLIVESNVLRYWENYNWIFTGKSIQKISAKQKEVYEMLQLLLKRLKKPEVPFFEEDVADLFSYVLPMLQSIGSVQIEGDQQKEMVQAPLKVKIYLRKSRNLLRARVDFQYEDVIFSTDKRYHKQQQKSQFVIRNYRKERQVFRCLEDLGFERGSTSYRKEFPEGQALYQLFYQEIPHLKKQGEVILEENVADRLLDGSQYAPRIAISENDSWLDFHFSVEGIQEDEVDELVLHLLNNEDFFQLQDGTILPLDSLEFQETSEALAKIRQKIAYKNGHFQVSRYEGLQVEEALGDMSNTTFSSSFKQMVEDLAYPENFQVNEPKGLQVEMRDYQKVGFRWLKMLKYYQFGGILADEMGLGKTLQAICFLLSEKEENPEIPPFLVVAPASLIFNWHKEFQRFAPSLDTVVVTGNKKEREEKIEKQKDVYITSYAGLRQDIENYQEKEFSILIIDEAQMVKNATTKTARAVRDLKIKQRIALSGTPIENNLEELWTLFQLIMPGLLPSKKKFAALKPQEVAHGIRPFVLRREKSEVLKDLPDKIETNLFSSLTEEQKTLYLAYLRKMQSAVATMDEASFRQNKISILAGLTRLRQICCDPRLCDPDFIGESGKLIQMKELVVKAIANKRRILLFSQFTSMLSIIQAELEALGIDTFYLRGSTKPKDRMDMVDAFNQGEKEVFLISLKAGGTGLNLTGADTVILYDLWWNPAVEEQATGRAHRMGQKKVVEVWRLISEGTIEEKIDRLQQEKKELFQQVLMADTEKENHRLTEADIREILTFGDE